MKKILDKNENQILFMLAFFSIGVGLWGNFRQLWLQDNGLNVSDISNILSLASLVTAVCICVSSVKMKLSKIKQFISFSLIFKVIVMIILSIINKLNYINLCKVLIIIDVILEKFIILSIYPLIVSIKKDNKLYSKRKLVEYLFRDIGILIGGLLIGKTIFNFQINYNTCLFISILFLIIAIFVIFNIKVNTNNVKSKISFKYIIKDKIIFLYLIDYFIGTIAMNTGLGLKMLMLTNKINFTASFATNYLLIVGLCADIIGILILKFFTKKNDYISLTIKFGIRMILYILAFIFNNIPIILLAMTWSILISTAYENITDAPYINRVKNEYQLFFTDIRYMVGMIAESIGLFFAGYMYNFGLNYMLGLSSLFIFIQLSIAYYLVYLRKLDEDIILKGNVKKSTKEKI